MGHIEYLDAGLEMQILNVLIEHEKVIMAWDGFVKDTLGENKFGKLKKSL